MTQSIGSGLTCLSQILRAQHQEVLHLLDEWRHEQMS